MEPEAGDRGRTGRLGSAVSPRAPPGCGGGAGREGTEPRTETGQWMSPGPALSRRGRETGNEPASLIPFLARDMRN